MYDFDFTGSETIAAIGKTDSSKYLHIFSSASRHFSRGQPGNGDKSSAIRAPEQAP
ncbi:MAG: hypothetical protein L6455_04830 [Kiritimatiellae bacterium]|nr:hypothetical protein [Verrucomicrobiota bacterium]MCG2679280.1 hypothetical protein [Kiritimatiellia bacterium]